ncbi:MAG: ribosome biogenesis GTPase Der [Deltaproteobacteria bacterium HGW-Deltaproteobacteria-21]|nr:MAG: ribosome biogenesis GTPase Der [Deltaproteobacteria bacterium HGW-Deltaproteobacteria-21]
MASIVAIVGRPNVGKSTLFNRLSRSRGALVDDQPGVTRDRLYASVYWEDGELTLVDTGGFEQFDADPIQTLVKGQVLKAVEEADRILFMVDGRQGVVSGDKEIGDLLRRTGKEVFLVVNKIDGPELEHLLSDFFTLGFTRVYSLSAAHGYGLKDLMNDLTEGLATSAPEAREEDSVRVAILGRPNVGKSSLINRILGEDRLVVSEIAGTTRDAIDILCTWKGKEYLFIDTAGIRRKGRVREKIEKFSMIKALKSLERCHVAVVMLDGSAGISDQDARICGYAFERGRAVLLAVNKWDLVKESREKRTFLESSLERQLKFLAFAPRINVSALTGQGVNRIFGVIDRLYGQYSKRIATGEVNEAVKEMLQQNPPPRAGRSALRVSYATQSSVRPPTFVLFVNHPEKVHFSYQRFLTNQIKERLGLELTPVRLVIKKKETGKRGS